MESRIVGLKLLGKFIGCAPVPEPHKSGDAAFPVYADRDALLAWEQVELTKRADGFYTARFVAANRQLCIAADLTLQSRAAGAIGPWETFRAAELPPDWPQRLVGDNGLVLDIVAS